MRPAPALLAAFVAPLLAAPAPAQGVTAEDAGVFKTYTLDGGAGVTATVTNWGARLLFVKCPDRDGRIVNVALGHGPELTDWIEAVERGVNPYFGATVGRYANRIAGGRFSLDGKDYTLATNAGRNHLHGGTVGFDRVRWEAGDVSEVASEERRREAQDEFERRLLAAPPEARRDLVRQYQDRFRGGRAALIPAVRFSHVSPDGAESYPGTLTAAVTYTLDGDTLRIEYEAATSEPTVFNPTQHAYFNLKGEGAGDVLGHELQIAADRYTPVDDALIPTGEVAAVTAPLDFREPKPIGRDIAETANGYDHNFVLNADGGEFRDGGEPAFAARVREPLTGRVLEVVTTEPGVQLYTAGGLNGSIVGTSGRPYERFGGFCLETQHFPDSPNKPEFPSTVLRPGETFRSVTTYRFTTDAAGGGDE